MLAYLRVYTLLLACLSFLKDCTFGKDSIPACRLAWCIIVNTHAHFRDNIAAFFFFFYHTKWRLKK